MNKTFSHHEDQVTTINMPDFPVMATGEAIPQATREVMQMVKLSLNISRGVELIGWLLFAGLVSLALFVSPWGWIAAIGVGFWKILKWYSYKGRPWRRIHFPMMRAYAAFLGFEHGQSENNGRDFDIRRAFVSLVKTMRPKWSFSQAQEFVTREYSRCTNFSDELLIKKYIQQKNKEMPRETIEELLALARQNFDASDNGLMARMIIAGIIEDQYGTKQRGEYLFEVLRGKAV